MLRTQGKAEDENPVMLTAIPVVDDDDDETRHGSDVESQLKVDSVKGAWAHNPFPL
jgi:hypothetical protein